MAESAQGRLQPAPADQLGRAITAENSASSRSGQVRHPILLSMARARLLEQSQQRPEPKPEVTIVDVRRQRRDRRRQCTARWLKTIPPHPSAVATVLGVSPRAVLYWRRGERAPTVGNWPKLAALYGLCRRDL
jgi:hypothetical protein